MAATPDMAAHIAADDALLDRDMLVIGWPHEAPERAFTVEGAHRAMQRHASCPLDTCARKRAARKTLVDAGHMVPDPRNSRGLE